MSNEQMPLTREALAEMEANEIAAILLPMLVADEALDESALLRVRDYALTKLDADPALSPEDALFAAADARLKVQEGLSEKVVVVSKDGLVHGVLPENEDTFSAVREVIADDLANRDQTSAN